ATIADADAMPTLMEPVAAAAAPPPADAELQQHQQHQQHQQQQQHHQQGDGVDGGEGREANAGDAGADAAVADAAATAASDAEASISGKAVPDGGATDGAGGAGGDGDGRRTPKHERGSNMDPMTHVRLHELRNNSAPLPEFMVRGGGSGASGGPQGVGRQRRLSFEPVSGASPGRKQRRHSWLQNSDGSGEISSPGGGNRKARKDTLYVNNLLSNALLGAWAATQSITQGRSNTPLGRLPRGIPGIATSPSPPLAISTATAAPAIAEGNSPLGYTPGAPSSLNTPVYGALRTAAINRSYVTPTNGGASGATSPIAGVPLNSALANRLDMEEALASRKSQHFTTQMLFLLRRACIKYVRSFWPMRVVDTLLQLAAAFIIGLVHGTRWSITSVPGNAVMCMVCLGVLSCVTHLRTFSNNRVLLWRECASGMSILAYFMAQNVIDQIWVVAAPALSLGVYYYLTLPRMPFSEFYVVGLFVCWWASGMAYLVSAVLPPQNVLMAGVFISLIFGAFLNGLTYAVATARGTLMEGIMGLSYNRWAMEIVTINELRNYQYDHRNTIIMMGKGIGLCGVDMKLADDGKPGISVGEALSYMALQENFDVDRYCSSHKAVGYGSLLAMGLGFRILAFALLRYNCVKRH
ncbi:hypothetical protein Vafri_1407, partial [Volvox africanus]